MSLDQTALEAKRYGVLTTEYNTKLAEATRLMVEEDFSALVVTDEDGYLTGILSRIDVIRAALLHDDWCDRQVEQFMHQDVVTVPMHATLRDVGEILLDHRIHRVVMVREEAGKKVPLSIISAADLVYHLVKDI